jgi:hypothetical protein
MIGWDGYSRCVVNGSSVGSFAGPETVVTLRHAAEYITQLRDAEHGCRMRALWAKAKALQGRCLLMRSGSLRGIPTRRTARRRNMRHTGHGRTCCQLDRVAIDPERTSEGARRTLIGYKNVRRTY